MANTNAKIDENHGYSALGVKDDGSGDTAPLLVDSTTGRLLIHIIPITDPVATELNKNSTDENYEWLATAVTDDASADETPLHVDNRNGYLFVDLLEE